jgi:hypothetical protein
MKRQKFFNIELVFENFDHLLGRNVIEAFLQFFFETRLKGRGLAEKIGNKRLFIINTQPNLAKAADKWWEKVFAITKIRDIDND